MAENSTHYTVLARRYRPQTFSEVVGQQHAAQVLRNAIEKGRVAHAYLFTGARGVGKTSMARILAKALNCPHVEHGDPCNQCDICLGVTAGHDVDVLEIDGASNRGIDDIRSLRANVNVKSMRTQYKIYIIDEVHMLTKEAFNALLKTLEEPPPNVKFVFCTTEPNKVPDTILSRCQRLDFATVETARITERLTQIAQSEGIAVAPAAVDLVARRAAGSMRDSQSLFDQLLAFGGDEISVEDVHRLLGTAPDDRLIELVDALIERRRDAALERFDSALAAGVQLGELTDQLVGYFRDLLITSAGAQGVGLSSVAESERENLQQQARRWGLQTIVAAMQILAETKSRMLRTNYGRPLAELALVRISLLEDLDQIVELVAQLKAGGPRSSPATGSAGDSRRAAPAARPAGPPGSAAGGAASGSAAKKKSESIGQPVIEPAADSSNGAAGTAEGSGSAANEPASDPFAARSTAFASDGPAELPESGGEPAEAENAVSCSPRVNFEKGREDELWTQLLSLMPDRVKDHLRRAAHIAISGPNHLDISFPKNYTFSKQYCERPEEFSRLTQALGRLTGQAIRATFSIVETDRSEARTAGPAKSPAKGASRRPLEPGDDPLVQQAVSLFGGTVVRIEELTTPSMHEE